MLSTCTVYKVPDKVTRTWESCLFVGGIKQVYYSTHARDINVTIASGHDKLQKQISRYTTHIFAGKQVLQPHEYLKQTC